MELLALWKLLDMDKPEIIAWVVILIVFVSGFGWGQWFAERAIRKERSKLEQGRHFVSVPMHQDEAHLVFKTIKNLADRHGM